MIFFIFYVVFEFAIELLVLKYFLDLLTVLVNYLKMFLMEYLVEYVELNKQILLFLPLNIEVLLHSIIYLSLCSFIFIILIHMI